MHPIASRQVQTGPTTSPNFQKLPKSYKKIEKSQKKIEKFSRSSRSGRRCFCFPCRCQAKDTATAAAANVAVAAAAAADAAPATAAAATAAAALQYFVHPLDQQLVRSVQEWALVDQSQSRFGLLRNLLNCAMRKV